MQVIIPIKVSDGTFSRASTGTYWSKTGVLSTAANNVLRITYDPADLDKPPFALIEDASTNLFLNSDSPVTQSISTSSATYSISFYGTGTIVLSGSMSSTVVGTGSLNRVSVTAAATAGTLTLTVSGSVSKVQVELKNNATSYIPTTSTAVTRAADVASNGLVYSNQVEPEALWPTWLVGSTYTIGAQVSLNGTRYVANSAVPAGKNPATDTTIPAYWSAQGPTNKYAMFDTVVGTQTISTSGEIICVIKNPSISALSFINMACDTIKVSLTDNASSVYYQATLDLSSADVINWLEYFTKPIERITDAVVTDIPPSTYSVLTVVISSQTGSAACGNLVNGSLYTFQNSGSFATSAGATIGIIDYSVKTVDDFGNARLIPRGYAKRMDVKLMIDAGAVDSAAQALTKVRATPCVWIGSDNDYQALIVYGYYKDWSIDIAYKTKSYCSITIEGLI